MKSPREIMKRAAMQQRIAPERPAERMPAPAPIKMQSQPAAMRPPEAPPCAPAPEVPCEDGTKREFRPVAQNLGGHAIYRELMRSHDRMGTRHVGPKG